MQDEWAGFTRAQGLVGLGAAGKACLSLRKGTARKSWSDALGEVDAIEVQQGGRWCHRAACRGRRPRSAEYRGDGLLAIRVVDEASVLVQTTRSVRSHDDHHLSVHGWYLLSTLCRTCKRQQQLSDQPGECAGQGRDGVSTAWRPPKKCAPAPQTSGRSSGSTARVGGGSESC